MKGLHRTRLGVARCLLPIKDGVLGQIPLSVFLNDVPSTSPTFSSHCVHNDKSVLSKLAVTRIAWCYVLSVNKMRHRSFLLAEN